MRFFASLLIVIFAFGVVDLRGLHAQNPVAVSCCCHESMACQCKTSAGQHACEVSQDFSGTSFRDWGCGVSHENPASPVFSKDFYHFELQEDEIKLALQSFCFVSDFNLKPAFTLLIDNPPELI